MTRRMTRAILALALLFATAPLGGCAVSLFSSEASPADEGRLTALERRMDAVEQRLPGR